MKEDKFERMTRLLTNKYNENDIPELSIIQLVGDRDNPNISMKNYAFTIPANPMSDRGQMVLEKNYAAQSNFNKLNIKQNNKGDYKMKNKGYKLINFCEFDKYASKSYCAIHDIDESLNLGDITKVDETKLEPFNMIVGGSPCQDFSVAGKQKGSVWTCKDCGEEYNPLTVHYSKRDRCPKCESENLDKSRSSLLVEWLRVIRHNKPNFGIYENVKNIVGKQFKETTFKLFEDELHEYGYNTYWQVMNAKDYTIPQNRERVFLILIKKDLDNGKFKFPDKMPLQLRLKDILEDVVDDKYYINTDKSTKLIEQLKADTTKEFLLGGEQKHQSVKYDGISTTLTSSMGCGGGYVPMINDTKATRIGGLFDDEKGVHQAGSIWDTDGLSPTVDTCQGGYRQPCVFDYRFDDGVRVKKDGNVHCINATHTGTSSISGQTLLAETNNNYRIRKLTPKECWRLMGFNDVDIDKCVEVGLSNTQLYKQAGNSIVTNCLYYILKELYIAMPYLFDDLRLSSYFSGIGAFEKALDRLFSEYIVKDENFMKPQVD